MGGRSPLDSGERDTASKLIDPGLWVHPDEPELLARSGFAYLNAQHYEEAHKAAVSRARPGSRRRAPAR
jgi:hypothetical protein